MVKTMPVPPRPPDDVTDPAHTGKYAEPLTSLRAGSVDIDARRIGRAIGVLLLVALVVVAVVLAVAGAQKNNQIDRLRKNGVPVTITVSSCARAAGRQWQQCGRVHLPRHVHRGRPPVHRGHPGQHLVPAGHDHPGRPGSG